MDSGNRGRLSGDIPFHKTIAKGFSGGNIDKSEQGPPRETGLAFPLRTETIVYQYHIDHSASCHWHNELELGLLLDGQAELWVNNERLTLSKGDLYFVGEAVLHMCLQTGGQDTVLAVLRFPSTLLSATEGGGLYDKYFAPLSQKHIQGFTIKGDQNPGKIMGELFGQIHSLEPAVYGYELEALSYFCRLWLGVIHHIKGNPPGVICRAENKRHSERMKEILSYIHAHYHEKITTEDIAHHANISRGECFRCFKQYMNKSITAYINELRLQQAAKQLRETEKPTIRISADCGFDSGSYFSKNFKKHYSMTPLQYKKARIWTENTDLHTNGYDYQYWKDAGSGTMIVAAGANNGAFSCHWQTMKNISFRSGKKFRGYPGKHGQIGQIHLQFDADYSSRGNSILCVYGWTKNPLVEWYIVECYTEYKPSLHGEYLGKLSIDGGEYELFRNHRYGQPSILGTADFAQYWSVRKECRLRGTVNVTAHLSAWEDFGLPMGGVSEVSFSVEGYHSEGTAVVKTNILTIEQQKKTPV